MTARAAQVYKNQRQHGTKHFSFVSEFSFWCFCFYCSKIPIMFLILKFVQDFRKNVRVFRNYSYFQNMFRISKIVHVYRHPIFLKNVLSNEHILKKNSWKKYKHFLKMQPFFENHQKNFEHMNILLKRGKYFETLKKI